MTKKLLLLVSIMIAAPATFGLAQTPPADAHHPRSQEMAAPDSTLPHGLPCWAHGLPPAEREELRRILDTRSQNLFPLVMRQKAKRAQLMAELAQNQVDRKGIDQTVQELSDLQAQLNQAKVDMMLEVKQQLPQVFRRMMMKGSGMGMGMMGGQGGGMMGGHGGGMMGCGGAGMMGGQGKGAMGGHGGGMMGGQGMGN